MWGTSISIAGRIITGGGACSGWSLIRVRAPFSAWSQGANRNRIGPPSRLTVKASRSRCARARWKRHANMLRRWGLRRCARFHDSRLRLAIISLRTKTKSNQSFVFRARNQAKRFRIGARRSWVRMRRCAARMVLWRNTTVSRRKKHVIRKQNYCFVWRKFLLSRGNCMALRRFGLPCRCARA